MRDNDMVKGSSGTEDTYTQLGSWSVQPTGFKAGRSPSQSSPSRSPGEVETSPLLKPQLAWKNWKESDITKPISMPPPAPPKVKLEDGSIFPLAGTLQMWEG